MRKQRQEVSAGPGGGERSEPEPGPAARRERGRSARRRGQTRRPYTPEERRAYVESFRASGVTQQAFCAASGVSTKTLEQWLRAYGERGDAGLEQLRWPPKRRGRPPMAKALAQEIVATQRSFPHFGLKRVRDYLARFVGLRVSAGGVRAVLAREGVPRAAAPPRRGPRRRRPAVRHFERARPGQLWQSDFTSFVLGRSGRAAHLIVFLDDCSRYVVAWHLDTSATAAIAKNTLRAAIEKYGKPQEVLTDQGPQYHAWRGKSAFRRLLEREGIRPVLSRSHHPETLGKCERLWETIGRELWDRTHPRELEEARERLSHFFAHYNHFRPHQGIGGLVPADRFFGAQSQVREAIERSISKNELRLALGERPRTPLYLVGRVGDEVVSLHGERGRVVVATQAGVVGALEVDELGASPAADRGDSAPQSDRAGSPRIHAAGPGGPEGPGTSSLGQERADPKEVHDGERDDDDNGDGGQSGPGAGGDEGGDAPAGERDPAGDGGSGAEAAAAAHGGVEVGAAGLPDQGDLGGGERGGEGEGAGPDDGGPGILAGPAEQDGAGAGARSAADPGVADEPAGGGGHGGGDAQAAQRQERGDAEARPGGQGTEEAHRVPRAGERDAAAADPGPADDAGQRAPRAPQGGAPWEEPGEEAAQGDGSTRSCAGGSGSGSSGNVGAATSASSPGRWA